jgi:SAM-dependent methyltransferase
MRDAAAGYHGAAVSGTERVVEAYTSAADHFDALPFWHHFGRLTVERLTLAPGERMVDLCCGSGASAIPAAERVGATGTVLGVDVTPALIGIARTHAAARGLGQARFEVADVSTLTLPAGSIDAVLSVFGLFFVDDMAGLLQRAWSWLAPGGRLATTVWGEVVLSPGEGVFWDAVEREDPSLRHLSPADRLAQPGALEQLHVEAGLPPPDVTLEHFRMPLATAEDFWPVILGTSNRGVFESLSVEAQMRVRRDVLTRLRDAQVHALDMDALVAVARKPR